MSGDDERTQKSDEGWNRTGLCGEAQADGVPCYELGRKCETCERARAALPPPAKPAPLQRGGPGSRRVP